jgi:hypothetical protein
MRTLYQFVLPDVANDGVTDYSDARRAFERDALSIAGGYTYLGTAIGAWQDKGRVFHERNHVYHVAADAKAAARLTNAAFDRFPDQYAIYRAEIGKGAMIERRRADVGADVLKPFPAYPAEIGAAPPRSVSAFIAEMDAKDRRAPLAAAAAPLTLSDL